MASLNWPPENTFRYEFNENLEMEIQAFDNDKKVKSKVNKGNKDQGREH